jgi:hypothetical protein
MALISENAVRLQNFIHKSPWIVNVTAFYWHKINLPMLRVYEQLKKDGVCLACEQSSMHCGVFTGCCKERASSNQKTVDGCRAGTP